MLWTINDVLFNKKGFKACRILDTTKGELKNQFANWSNQLKMNNSVGRYINWEVHSFWNNQEIPLFLLIPKFSYFLKCPVQNPILKTSYLFHIQALFLLKIYINTIFPFIISSLYGSVSQPLWDRGPVKPFFMRRGPGLNKFTHK